MYFIHALPFTNSAVNWILYGALNSQLQHRYKGGRSTETMTLVPNGNSSCPTPKTAPFVNGINAAQRVSIRIKKLFFNFQSLVSDIILPIQLHQI